LSRIVLFFPGVPPLKEFVADQLSFILQFQLGLIRSKLQPPFRFVVLLYQLSLYVISSNILSPFVSFIVAPELFNAYHLGSARAFPYLVNRASDSAAHKITYWLGAIL